MRVRVCGGDVQRHGEGDDTFINQWSSCIYMCRFATASPGVSGTQTTACVNTRWGLGNNTASKISGNMLQGMVPRRVDTRDIPCQEGPQHFTTSRSYSGIFQKNVLFKIDTNCLYASIIQ